MNPRTEYCHRFWSRQLQKGFTRTQCILSMEIRYSIDKIKAICGRYSASISVLVPKALLNLLYPAAGSAIIYAEKGWYLFPCHPITHEPMVKWREQSTTDLSTIVSWWMESPSAAIGIDCQASEVTVLTIPYTAEALQEREKYTWVPSWVWVDQKNGTRSEIYEYEVDMPSFEHIQHKTEYAILPVLYHKYYPTISVNTSEVQRMMSKKAKKKLDI